MNRDALISELRALSFLPGQVTGDAVALPFLKEAEGLGLARRSRSGAMRMAENRRPENIVLQGRSIPIVGTLYDVWDLIGDAATQETEGMQAAPSPAVAAPSSSLHDAAVTAERKP